MWQLVMSSIIIMMKKIEEDDPPVAKKKRHPVKAAAVILVLLLAGILSFLGLEPDSSKELGIESQKQEAVSKPELMMELEEMVMDTQNIYAVVKITAPPGIEFNAFVDTGKGLFFIVTESCIRGEKGFRLLLSGHWSEAHKECVIVHCIFP